MKTKLIAAILFASLIATNTTAWAEEKPPQLKSTTTAWILGLDPIPGDALFFAGKPIQGTINVLLGAAGAVFFSWGLIDYSKCADPDSDWCGLSKIPMSLGAFVYFPMLIWDAIGGIGGVNAHNEQVRKQQTSVWQRVQPSFAVTNEGVMGGVNITF